MACSRTPKKRRRNDSICLSPFFSRTKHKKARNEASSPANEPVVTEENLSDDDPLSLFYARSFSKLYEELEHLKPVLIQEQVAGDKWKVLVACTLLNKTSGKLALPVFWDMMDKWPTPWAMSQAKEEDLVSMLLRLGTQTVRAKRLVALSRDYLKDPPSNNDPRPSRPSTPVRGTSESPKKRSQRYPATPVSHFPGSGTYALDSYRIFCTVHDDPTSTEWQRVLPSDKELKRYLVWKWAVKEHREWSSTEGPGQPPSLSYLQSLKSQLSQHLKSTPTESDYSSSIKDT